MSGIVCLPEWLTPKGVAAVFGINRTRLAELKAAGEIRWKKLAVRDGGSGRGARILVNAQSLREWIDRQEGN